MTKCRSKFTYDIDKKLNLKIIDIGTDCMSVTNDMENVLNFIIETEHINNIDDFTISYCDSMGDWDFISPIIDRRGKVIDVNFICSNHEIH
jgi:hypothetical protein